MNCIKKNFLTPVLSLITFSLIAQCNISVAINSNTDPLLGCSGVVTITNTFTISTNYDLSTSGITELRIGAGGSLVINSNRTLTLPSSALLSIISGGTISGPNPCNNNQLVVIGSSSASCSGDGADWSFTEVQDGKGFNQSGLPVELSYFNAILKEYSTQLSWQTSTELNNAKFIIETTAQGEVFQPLGEVAGAGTTTEPQNYSFTHHTPSAGINYYRLKQVDFDGTFEYSKVIAIEAAGSNDIFAFPNPARDKVTLQYDQSKGAGNIQLLDGLGRRIQARITGYAGNYDLSLPESLARGTYWLKVERGGKVQTLPVVKE